MPNTRRNNRRNKKNMKSRKQHGGIGEGGVLMDVQWYNPSVLPPSSSGPFPSSYSTQDAVRPVLLASQPPGLAPYPGSVGGRRNRRRDHRKQHGGVGEGGVLMDVQWYNPELLPPSSSGPFPSSYSTQDAIRPVMLATQPPGLAAPSQAGGRNKTRNNRKNNRKHSRNNKRK